MWTHMFHNTLTRTSHTALLNIKETKKHDSLILANKNYLSLNSLRPLPLCMPLLPDLGRFYQNHAGGAAVKSASIQRSQTSRWQDESSPQACSVKLSHCFSHFKTSCQLLKYWNFYLWISMASLKTFIRSYSDPFWRTSWCYMAWPTMFSKEHCDIRKKKWKLY